MKKIIVLLVAAYIGVLAFEYHQKAQTIKVWNDERWQYCLKVLYNNDFKKPSDTFLFRWKDDLRILIYGNPTNEDKKTLERAISQFNQLIFPRKITIDQETFGKEITRIKANIFICFRFCRRGFSHRQTDNSALIIKRPIPFKEY